MERPSIKESLVAAKPVEEGDSAASNEHCMNGDSSHKLFLGSCPQSPKIFSVTAEIDWMQLLLFGVALITRTWRLDWPQAVVFDELHYVKYIGLYMNSTFFFDTNPPLGKLILSISGYLSEFSGYTPFDRIGSEYVDSTPVWQLRIVPALCGSLLVPVVYQILVEYGSSRWTAVLAALLTICENSFLTEARFVLIEGIVVFFGACTILMLLKFRNNSHRPFTSPWWDSLLLLGIFSSLTLSVRYIGAMTCCLCFIFVLHDLWKLIADQTLSDRTIIKHVSARVFCLIIFPMMLYLGIFYVHLSLLYKAGPSDKIMTSAFQASLQGGLASIVKGQPLSVVYGSQVTLRHTYAPPCWLHSHLHVYPIRYDDGRGSSHQQQVSCYSFKDVNNWWIIKHPQRSNITVDDPPQAVRHGEIIQLVHGMTSRVLNSHDVAAPLSPQLQEVSCYIDYNVSATSYNLWKVEIINRDVEGDEWKTIQSQIRLIHVETEQVLKMSGKQFPDWGFYQFEVATDRVVQQDLAIWNVEEHRYTRVPDQKQREKELAESEMIPLEPTKLGFLSKFWELQIKMLTSSLDEKMEHRYSSDPSEWPTMDRNVAYWISPHNNAQIQLLGNVTIWYTALEFFVMYIVAMVVLSLARRRRLLVVSDDLWYDWVFMGQLFLGGYILHYVPFYIVEKTYFLYHYLPAVLYKILFLAAAVEKAYFSLWSEWLRQFFIGIMCLWLSGVVYTFFKFAAFSYGLRDFDNEELESLYWKKTWDFIIRR